MTGNYFAVLPVTLPEGTFDSLQADAPPALRWFHSDDLHLTLAFFGKEQADRIPAILAIVESIPFQGIEATLGPFHPLPRPKRFSALSFELDDGREEIAALIASWRAPLCEAAGIDPDQRPPRPHLTIARPARKHPEFRPREVLQWARQYQAPPGPVQIHPATLYGWSPERPKRQFRQISSPGRSMNPPCD